ncbi:MAG: hypothetical protein K6E91_14640 [Butyrivibrio sp.]|nr:hypothetical protein [Butyrivibrio sp.]
MTLISCLLDVAAVALMIYLLTTQKKQLDRVDIVDENFRSLIMVVIVMSAADLLWTIIGTGINQKAMTGDRYWLELVFNIAAVYLTTVFLYFWFYFLSWHLYHDRGYLKRRFRRDLLPMVISSAMLIGSGILLAISDGAAVFFGVAYSAFIIIRLYYFAYSLWYLYDYKKQNGYFRFFNVWAFFLPVFGGWLLQDLGVLNLCALGSAIGVYLLYASMAAKQQYMDEETAFYNTAYIDYLKELISKDAFNPCSAMVFDVEEGRGIKSFSEILKKALPQDCEPIRCAKRRIVVLTCVLGRGPLNMVLQDVRDASQVEGNVKLKKKNESATEFMERVL